jgi:hypothetical protein
MSSTMQMFIITWHVEKPINDGKRHLQFRMSEMNTANPRIPSPFDTAGIFAGFCPHSGLSRKKCNCRWSAIKRQLAFRCYSEGCVSLFPS